VDEEDRNTENTDDSEEGEFEECEGWCNIHGEDNGGVYSTGKLI
jgi:hypothetical protein